MNRILVNQRAGRRGEFPDPGSSSISFHSRLPGYSPTPLRESAAAAELLGAGRVLVKDESARFGLPAFKILGASYAFYRELRRVGGFLDSDWCGLDDLRSMCESILPRGLVTATDGNHGRGVARTAGWFGIEAHVFVPEGTAPARIEGIESEGASVSVVRGDYDETVAEAAGRAGGDLWLIQDTAWEGYEEIPLIIAEGYSTIMLELDAQLEEAGMPEPDLAAVQIGVGSLAAAMVSHIRLRGGGTVIAGVEPEGAACGLETAKAGRIVTVPGPHRSVMAGLNCGTLSTTAWPVLRDGIDLFVTASDEDAFEAMRTLASDGIISGESGSAGLAGLAALLRTGEGRSLLGSLGIGAGFDVLVISTEGVTDPDLYRRVVSPPGR